MKLSGKRISRLKRSNTDLSMKINERNNSKKKFRLSFMNKFIWYKKKDTIISKLPSMIPSAAPYIEDLQNEFMRTLNNKLRTQDTKEGERDTLINLHNFSKESLKKRRLLITRSIDDFARKSRRRHLYSSLSSQFLLHQPLLTNAPRRTSQSNLSLTVIPRCSRKSNILSGSIKSESCLKNSQSTTSPQLTLRSSFRSISTHSSSHDAAIIDIDHQSHLSLNKSLEKSHSSPLPMNTNHSSTSQNFVRSAHMIDQHFYENKHVISLQSCASEMGDEQSTESISSDEESVQRSRIQSKKKNLRHRWSLLDTWQTTMTKLPAIFNRIWRKQLRQTGSREFLLEYDQTLSTNNNNHYRANLTQEQRYVEQERPIHSHIGLALLALLIFPPVGILAFMLSLWSLCGQQDRHLSRKFGNAIYWISILAICLSFLLLFTLFTYFTYQYLIHRPRIIHRYLTTDRIDHSITKDIDYISK